MNTNNEKLTGLKLHHDKDTNEYYLEAIYEFENSSGKYKRTFPHIHLTVNTHIMPEIRGELPFYPRPYTYYTDENFIDLGFGECAIKDGTVFLSDTAKDSHTLGHKCRYYTEKLEDYGKELTIEEIEEKLGYKIKIVDKERK